MQGHQCAKGKPNWSTDGTVLCIHVLPLKFIQLLYIYIYIGANKQFISLQTYRHTPMHILTLYNAFNYQIYIKYKFICSAPYLRRNPCQEEILTRQHHDFRLNNNPTILLMFHCGFFPLLQHCQTFSSSIKSKSCHFSALIYSKQYPPIGNDRQARLLQVQNVLIILFTEI